MKSLLQRTILFGCLLLLTATFSHGQLNKHYYLNRARLSIGSGEYSHAISTLNILIRADSTIADAWFLRGVTKYNLNDFHGALQDLSHAIRLNPIQSQTYLYRGSVLSNLSRYEEAIKDFDLTIDLRPNEPEGYYNRGLAYFFNNKVEAALKDFNKAIVLDPRNYNMWLTRGNAKLQKADTTGALADFSKAVTLGPFAAQPISQRGRLYYTLKQHNMAIDDLSKAIVLDSLNAISYFFRALVYNEINEDEKALQDINQAIDILPDNALSIYNRALIHWKRKENQQALDDFNRVAEINPQNVFVHYNRSVLLAEMKRYNLAIEGFSRAIELFPHFANAYVGRAAAHAQTGNFKQSLSDRKFANEIAQIHSSDHSNPLTDTTSNLRHLVVFDSDFSPKTTVSFLAEFVDKPVDILPFFQVIIEKVSKDAVFITGYTPLDDINNSLKNNGLALTFAINKGENLYTEDNAHEGWLETFFKAIWHSNQQRYNMALELYEQLATNFPENPLIQNNLGIVQAEMIDFVASFSEPSEVLGINMQSLGNDKKKEFTPKANDYHKAIEVFIALTKEYPHNPHFLYNLGNLYALTHQFETASMYYTKAIENSEGMAEAWYNRGLIGLMLQQKEQSCIDLSQAGELGIKQAYLLIQRLCQQE